MDEKKLQRKSLFIPYNPALKKRARELRTEMTQSEKKLWYDFLRTLPQRFLRQKPLGGYVVDFFCNQQKLIIEVDGESHYTEEGKQHDAIRTRKLEELGFRIIRFTNTDVAKNFRGVCETILKELEKE